jgi:hypothetical protein
MARGKEIPEAVRNQIIGMRKAGYTFVAIGAEYEMNENTARKIYDRWVESRTCENAPRPGAPKLLTNGDIRQIKRYICHDREARRQPLGDIIVDLNLPVSKRTLERTIKNDIGLGHRIERKTPWLSPKQKAARLAFAKEHLNWGFDEWIRV